MCRTLPVSLFWLMLPSLSFAVITLSRFHPRKSLASSSFSSEGIVAVAAILSWFFVSSEEIAVVARLDATVLAVAVNLLSRFRLRKPPVVARLDATVVCGCRHSLSRFRQEKIAVVIVLAVALWGFFFRPRNPSSWS